jgi:hypothetical protein
MTALYRPTALPAWAVSAIAAAALVHALSLPALGQVVAAQDGTVNRLTYTLTVTLIANGTSVASTQNSITFDSTNTPIPRNSVTGLPSCFNNSAIQKEATTFSFLPAGCTGTACTKVMAIVKSNVNTTPIPDGATLYTCNVSPSWGTAPAHDYMFTVGDVSATDPSGQPLVGADGRDGELDVAPALKLIGAGGSHGSTTTFSVSVWYSGSTVLAAENTITFDSTKVPIARNADGTPACTVNPAIQKPDTAFRFLPPGCTGTACTQVSAVVMSMSDLTTTIPDQSTLYTCTVNIAGTPEGYYTLTLGNADVTVRRQGIGGTFLKETPNQVNGYIGVPSGGGGC